DDNGTTNSPGDNSGGGPSNQGGSTDSSQDGGPTGVTGDDPGTPDGSQGDATGSPGDNGDGSTDGGPTTISGDSGDGAPPTGASPVTNGPTAPWGGHHDHSCPAPKDSSTDNQSVDVPVPADPEQD